MGLIKLIKYINLRHGAREKLRIVFKLYITIILRGFKRVDHIALGNSNSVSNADLDK